MGLAPTLISEPNFGRFTEPFRTSLSRISSWICWRSLIRSSRPASERSTNLGRNTLFQAGAPGDAPIAARLRRLPEWAPRQGGRPRAGHDDESLGEAGQLPDGHQHQGLAVHDPAQRIL